MSVGCQNKPISLRPGDWILATVAFFMLGTVSHAQAATDSFNTGPADGRQVNLRTQLTAGLKAFTKDDFKFIDDVVKAVEDKRLPRKLVDSYFLWARKKAAWKSYARSLRPMVYFRPGLTLAAKRFNVKL